MKKLFAAIVLTAALTSGAMAGNATLKKDGKKVSLWCNNSACYTAQRISAFKKGPKKRIGPGGRANFLKHRKSMKAKGWK